MKFTKIFSFFNLIMIFVVSAANAHQLKIFASDSHSRLATYFQSFDDKPVFMSQPEYPEVFRVGNTLDRFDTSRIPALSSEELKSAFVQIRDTRHIESTVNLSVKMRRAPWLYIPDGCVFRAYESTKILKNPLAKLFVKIPAMKSICSKYLPGSCVTGWVFHVALAAKVENDIFVLDPAIDAVGPMPLHAWARTILTDEAITTATFSACESHSFAPGDTCWGPRPDHLQKQLDEIIPQNFTQMFLNYEWAEVERLNQDPHAGLGDSPPWN